MGYALAKLGFGVERARRAGGLDESQPRSCRRRPIRCCRSRCRVWTAVSWWTWVSAARRSRRRPARGRSGTAHPPRAVSAARARRGLPAGGRDPRRLAAALHVQHPPQPRIDLEVGSWYVSTYPMSVFVVGLTAALVTDDGGGYARPQSGDPQRQRHRRIRFDTAAQVLGARTDRFGIDLTDLGDQHDLEARSTEVLNTSSHRNCHVPRAEFGPYSVNVSEHPTPPGVTACVNCSTRSSTSAIPMSGTWRAAATRRSSTSPARCAADRRVAGRAAPPQHSSAPPGGCSGDTVATPWTG